MASFAALFPVIMDLEKGYANVSGDSGGETYKGVARNYHPNWRGWELVDAEKRKLGGRLPHGYLIPSPLLDRMVELFTKMEYWDYFHADRIKSQEVADMIVDWGYNSGKVTAAKQVQELLSLTPDGKFGEVTLRAINGQHPERLFHRIQQARLRFVEDIARRRPEKQKFLAGWKNRILRFESPETKKRWLALKIGGSLLAAGAAGYGWFVSTNRKG